MKTLIISLDDDIQFTHISYNATQKAIHDGLPLIITPIVTFFNTSYTCEKYGYQVYARNKDKEICLNDLMLKKEIRLIHNVCSMLLSGVFEVYPDSEE